LHTDVPVLALPGDPGYRVPDTIVRRPAATAGWRRPGGWRGVSTRRGRSSGV